MHTVFVYGTLKRGYSNHGVMERSGGTYLKEYTTQPTYKMLNLGSFPAAIKGMSSIKGELWSVENLNHLDRLEGHPTFYKRELVKDGAEEFWIYLLPGNYAESNKEVVGGQW